MSHLFNHYPICATALLAVGLLMPQQARSQLTCNFTGGTGSWQTSSNWDCGQVPGAADTAVVSSGDVVSIDSPVTVASVSQASGTIQGDADIDITTNWTWTAGTFTGSGTVTNQGTATISGGTLTRALVNTGTINQSGTFDIAAGGNVDNQNIFNMTADGNVGRFQSTAVLTNSGTVSKSGGTGNSIIEMTLNSTGTVDVQSGTLLFRNTASLDGIASGSPGTTFRFDTGTQTLETGLDLDAATISFTSSGTNDINTTDFTIDSMVVSSKVINFSNADYVIPNLNQGSGTIQGDADIDITTSWTWTAGTFTGSGTVTNQGTATISGGTLTRALVNTGTINQSGTFDIAAGGNVDNQNIFNMTADGNVGRFQSTAVLTNSGTVSKSGGTGNSIIEMTLNSTGTVDVQSGTLLFRNTASLDGIASGSPGTTFRFDTGTQTLETGLDLDAATISFTSSGTNDINTTDFTIDSMVVSSKVINFSNADYVIPNLNQGSGTIQGDADIDITTSWTWTAGTFSGAGTVTNQGTATISGGTLTRPLVNTGTINQRGSFDIAAGGNVDNQNTFNMTADGNVGRFQSTAVMTNSGTVSKTGGTGNSIIDLTLNSTGTVDVQSGTFLFRNTASLDGIATGSPGSTFRFDTGTQTLETGLDLDAATLSFTSSGTNDINTTDFTIDSMVVSSKVINFSNADYVIPNLNQGSGTIQGDADIDITTSWTWTAGTFSGAGTVTNQGTATISGGTLTRPLVNTGTINQRGSFDIAAGGNVDNQNTFNMTADGNVGRFQSTAVMTNSGTVSKTGGTGNSIIDLTLNSTGTVDVQSGTFLFRNTASLDGIATGSPGSTFRFDTGNQTLETGLDLNADTLSFTSSGTTTFNCDSATIVNLVQSSKNLQLDGALLMVTGNFTRVGGTFGATGMVSFVGAGEQLLALSNATPFHDLMVGSGTILVETQSLDNGTINGLLFNDGIIRKTQTINTVGSRSFGLTGVQTDVLEVGSLSSLQVDRRDNGPSPIDFRQTEPTYWDITPQGEDYVLDLVLPHNFPDRDFDALACRFNGTGWNCDRSISNPDTVTLEDVQALSLWTTGDGDLILVDDYEGLFIEIPEGE